MSPTTQVLHESCVCGNRGPWRLNSNAFCHLRENPARLRRREPRTTWRAKPLFDRRLECVDERAAPSAM